MKLASSALIALVLLLLPNLGFAQDGAASTGVITGKAVDHRNQPVAGVTLRLFGMATLSSTPALLQEIVTSETGEFRLEGLAPQIYTVRVNDRQYRADESRMDMADRRNSFLYLELGPTETLDLRIPVYQPAVLTGTVRDTKGDPVPQARVSAMRYVVRNHRRSFELVASGLTDDRGAYRLATVPPGETILRAMPPNRAQDLRILAPVYFGGGQAPDSAKPLTITAGAELRAIDMMMEAVASHTLTVRVVDKTTGQSAITGGVVAIPGYLPTQSMGVAQIQPGVHRLKRLIPGTYTVTTVEARGQPFLCGTATAEIRDQDVEVELRVSPGATIAGTMTIDDGSPLPRLGSYSVALDLAASRGTHYREPEWLGVSADGSITAEHFLPGRYFLFLQPLPDLYLKSINGKELQPADPAWVDLSDEGTNRLNLVFSAHPATVTGTVPSPAWVALWPDLKDAPFQLDRWNPFKLHVELNEPGKPFSIRGLVPGSYRIAAIDFDAPDSDVWVYDPEFLRRLPSTTLTIAEDAEQSVEIPVIPAPEIMRVEDELR